MDDSGAALFSHLILSPDIEKGDSDYLPPPTNHTYTDKRTKGEIATRSPWWILTRCSRIIFLWRNAKIDCRERAVQISAFYAFDWCSWLFGFWLEREYVVHVMTGECFAGQSISPCSYCLTVNLIFTYLHGPHMLLWMHKKGIHRWSQDHRDG